MPTLRQEDDDVGEGGGGISNDNISVLLILRVFTIPSEQGILWDIQMSGTDVESMAAKRYRRGKYVVATKKSLFSSSGLTCGAVQRLWSDAQTPYSACSSRRIGYNHCESPDPFQTDHDPKWISNHGKVYKWDHEKFADWVEQAAKDAGR